MMAWPPDAETMAAIEWLESLENLMHPTVTVMRPMFQLINDNEHGDTWEHYLTTTMRGLPDDYRRADAA